MTRGVCGTAEFLLFSDDVKNPVTIDKGILLAPGVTLGLVIAMVGTVERQFPFTRIDGLPIEFVAPQENPGMGGGSSCHRPFAIYAGTSSDQQRQEGRR